MKEIVAQSHWGVKGHIGGPFMGWLLSAVQVSLASAHCSVPATEDGPLTAAIGGFKVPVSALDRFLKATSAMETVGYAPFYGRDELDDASKLFRAKLGGGDTKTILSMPYKMGHDRSKYVYVAYAWAFVYFQRRLDIVEELSDVPPEGFAELRREMMGFAEEGEGVQDDALAGLFVINTDEQWFGFREPFTRKTDLRCAYCGAVFQYFFDKLAHCKTFHGSKEGDGDLPGNL